MASSSVTPGHGWLILFMVISLITLSHTQESTQVITARQLYPLTSYKDVQLFRFQVSEEVTLGQWTLWSNGTKGCDPIQVRFHLRWKGYPLLNVNNATISGNMFLDKKDQHQVELQSDSVQVHFNLTNPLPGDWFALAYISQVDDRIVQRGLFTKCQAWFSASLTQSHLPLRKDGQRSLTLAPGQPLMQVVSSHRYYRFQVPQEVTNVRVNITHCKVVGKLDHSHSVSSCPLDLSFRTSALPSRHYLKKTSNCQEHFEAESCQLSSLAVTYGGWNYIFVEVIKASHEDKFKVEFKITLHTEECTERSVHQVVHPSTPLPSTVSSTTVATSTALSSTTEIQGEDDAEWPDPDRESSAVEEASTETSPVLSVSEGNDSETDETEDAEPKAEKPDIEGPKPESEIEAPTVENPKSEDLPESTSIGSVWSLSTEPGSGPRCSRCCSTCDAKPETPKPPSLLEPQLT
ncbi:hypothetical protein HDE_13798 [Halotydeus destructor]|nr:hypothetical protein HDE_13798 [Halotydeus destructor]